MIYFAMLQTQSIKIGCSEDVETRLIQLASHYGVEPILLATMPGDRSTEAEIHDRFAHLRLGRTEQFRPSMDLMAFIGKPLLMDVNPEAVEIAPPRVKQIPLIRVSEAFAEAMRDAAGFEKTSMADFADAHLLSVVKRRYRDQVMKTAKRLEGSED